ncbi:cytochrome P450 CYP736A12-like [Hevea brasiliensis]|uniref:cytochrome P450 CYP736A12-like n=1 Tax=Hevea brasiliensis TaxID=3981 RepID=UPI0025D3A9B3|nr:cytochrome P450 CYP736A12-like [Hevea brasiliensis]
MSPIVSAIFLVLLGSLLPFIRYLLRCAGNYKNGQKLPPGPRPLPIIGNLHILGNLPHRSLYHLAKDYGPIMSLRLGSVPTIVVSSSQAAELFLKTYDSIFASRPKLQASLMSYDSKGMAFTEYGSHWRYTRKLSALHLLSASKVESFAPMRREKMGSLVDSLKKAAAAKEVVDFSARVEAVIQNMTYKMVFGGSDDDEFDMKSLIMENMNLAGAFNVADYVPCLAAFDLQGLTRRMKAFSKKMDEVLEKIINEHAKEAQYKKNQPKDFIDELLSLMDNSQEEIDRANIKALMIEMIVGAFDTSAATVEWTFAELLRNPRVMKRLQEEMDNVVGLNRMVEEKDLPKLTYLEMVIKESLRLRPVGPLLIPHESTEDITINGYHIPSKSRIMVNAWAIGRDPSAWPDNAEEFFPERFKATNIDLRGHDFQLIPFGSGRRGCPGMHLGLTTVRLVLAQLLHCFDWELPDGLLPNEMDMSERFTLTMLKATHLLAVPKYRLLVDNV